jgi:hypothetical protein
MSLGRRVVLVSERLQPVAHHPHAELLRVGSKGHGEGSRGPLNLVLTGSAAHLIGRFGEVEKSRGADRVRRMDAAGAIDGNRTTDLCVTPISVSRRSEVEEGQGEQQQCRCRAQDRP